MNTRPLISVFSKPWPKHSAANLSDLLLSLGFKGIELPIREGFQVTPDTIDSALLKFASELRKNGLDIFSVAGDMDEVTIRACGESGIPILRTMLKLDLSLSYQENVDTFRRQCEELYPALQDSGVSIGLQNHCDGFACSSLSVIHAIEPLRSDCVSAVLDLGHTGLEGEREDLAIDIAWSRLSMINLKNAIRFPDGTDAAGAVKWNRTWVSGKEGYTSWNEVISELAKRNYNDPICITAEYKDDKMQALTGNSVIEPLRQDMHFLQSLLNTHY